jgi:SAM-dependent methyltransferase
MPDFVVEYGKKGTPPAASDGRLDAPAFHRNHEAIWAAIAEFLLRRCGDVLEIGSGTGQHVIAYARRTPKLDWWPSDISPAHLASIAAWQSYASLANVRAPQRIDLADPNWTWVSDGKATGKLAAILCINVLHISPWRVSENLMRGAGRLLVSGGRLMAYGPFMRDGLHIAPSNAAFDQSLRTENPEWGVRDVRDLHAAAEAAGLKLVDIATMPANNLVLTFARSVAKD